MTEGLIPDELQAAAELIAGLPTAERKAAQKQLRGLIAARLPDDEIGKPQVQSLGEYLDQEIELPPMLVEPGLIARGGITAMIARGGKGKTSISLNKLVRWSMGKPLFDDLPDVLNPVQPLRSLIIENEGAPGHFQDVCSRIVTRNDFTDDERKMARENIHVWGDGGWSGLKLDNPESLKVVDRAVRETESDILFIEPFRGLWKGDENNSTEMHNVLDALSELASNNNCAVIVTHHERKGAPGEGGDVMDAARGSSVMEGVVAVMERWRQVKAGQQSEISWIKNRFREQPAPVRVTFNREKWSYEYVSESANARNLLQMLEQEPGEWLSAKDIADDLDENYANVRRWANDLYEEGRCRRRRIEGKYSYAYKDPDAENGSALDI